ncbi:MAG TPA: hypothetical protein VH518_06460 [Tepidisphaeraceae bacterium]|jgi:hypothetical protein
MIRKLNSLKKLVLAGALGVAGLVPAASTFAGDRWDHGDRYDHHDWHHDNHDNGHYFFGIRIGEPYPAYPAPVTQRVWVAPVYQTVCDHVWVEPVYRTDCDRVWVEPAYQARNVVRWEHGRRVVCSEQVLVAAGHFEDRPHQVLVTPGHFEDVQRQVVLTPGHWEDRPVVVAAPVAPANDSFSFSFGYHGH